MKTCRRCLLTEAHPGVELDAEGVCSACRAYVDSKPPGLAAVREALAPHVGKSRYDCLVCWSGGKDSTYVLDVLVRELGLRVAAFTFDNTFTAPGAFANMRRVREQIDVYHVVTRPAAESYRRGVTAAFERLATLPADSLFGRALRRHGPACYHCGAVFHSAAVALALELDCPVIATGFTAGQDPAFYGDYRGSEGGPAARLHRIDHWATIGKLMQRFLDDAGAPTEGIFLTDEQAARASDLRMFRLFDFLPYAPAAVVEHVQGLGWQRPEETDSCSSNCLLNGLGILWYQREFGCHPYAPEMSAMIRRGAISRADAQAALAARPDPAGAQKIADELGLSPGHLGEDSE